MISQYILPTQIKWLSVKLCLNYWMNFCPFKLFQRRNFNMLKDTYMWKYVSLGHFSYVSFNIIYISGIVKLTGIGGLWVFGARNQVILKGYINSLLYVWHWVRQWGGLIIIWQFKRKQEERRENGIFRLFHLFWMRTLQCFWFSWKLIVFLYSLVPQGISYASYIYCF